MINTEDIMQGNYMLWQGEVIKVDGCVASMIYFWNNGKNDGNESELKIVNSAHFNPIPLTPELLEKCPDFVWDKNYDCYYFNGISVYFLKDILHYCKVKYRAIINIKYLHELQNLVKVLTGKPLNINL